MKIEPLSHWYDPRTGEPKHFVEKKDGSGLRPTTLRDAKAHGWYPSVTTILKVLHKEALVHWLIRQAVLTVMTAPRLTEESVDAFVDRVLSKERQQDEEAKKARDRGTDIHEALERQLSGQECDAEIFPWIAPCLAEIQKRGTVLEIEKILVGNGYAGKTDLIQQGGECVWILDYKSTTKLPEKASWLEHRLQLAAYAHAYYTSQNNLSANGIRTANVYISTVECGEFIIHENPVWLGDYMRGFLPLVKYWQWANNYNL